MKRLYVIRLICLIVALTSLHTHAAGRSSKKPPALRLYTEMAGLDALNAQIHARDNPSWLNLPTQADAGWDVCLSQCNRSETASRDNNGRYGGVAGITGSNDPVLTGRGVMGVGLNWAASPAVQLSADYAKQLDTNLRAGRQPDEVLRARLNLAF